MFVGCSEISVSVIVKHVQHIGIVRAFFLPGENLISFSVPEGTEKIAGLWLAKGESVPILTLWLPSVSV